MVLWTFAGILALVVVVCAAGFWILVRTQPGHDFVLRMSLRQLEGRVNGTIAVDGLRSDGLLRGFTLHGVSIADDRGRPFAEVDSLRLRYSLRALLRREIVLVPADVWHPRVVLETLHGDSASNVARIFAREQTAPDTLAVPWTLTLGQTAVQDGSLVVRIPVDEEGEAGTYETLEGVGAGTYRTLRFEDVQAEIADADLLGSEGRGEAVRFDELSFVGHVLAEPMVVTRLRGDVVREGEAVRVTMDPLETPESEVRGEARVAWGGPEVEIDIDASAPRFVFADFGWLAPDLPDGGGSLDLRVTGPLSALQIRAADADVRVGQSRVVGQGGVDLGEELRFAEVDVRLDPLSVRDLDPWTEEPLPFDGDVRGDFTAEGPLRALSLAGTFEYEDVKAGVPPSGGDIQGVIGLEDPWRVSDLIVTVEPLQFRTLSAFVPDLAIDGVGRLRATASGDLDSGIQVDMEVEHRVGEGPASLVMLSGAIGNGEEIVLALSGTMRPLSLDGLAVGLARDLPVSGDVSGTLRLVGPLSDLTVSGSLETAGGPVDANVRLNARDPFGRYRVEGNVAGFQLAELLDGVPDSTVLTGAFALDGSGSTVEDLEGVGSVALQASTVGPIGLNAVEVQLRAVGGRLIVEELIAESPIGSLTGSGELGLREGETGQVSVVWVVDSLSALRPVVFGDETIVADTLTPLEREVLRFDGIDPDTLAATGSVPLSGRAQGETVFRGTVRDLEAEGFAEVFEFAYDGTRVSAARADLTASWRGSDDWVTQGVLTFDSATVQGFELSEGGGAGSYGPAGGTFDVALMGTSQEVYTAAGAFAQDSLGIDVELASLEMEAPETTWRLQGVTQLRVEGTMVSTDGLRLIGDTEAEITARGTVDLEGESSFALSVQGVDLTELGTVSQTDRFPAGLLDLEARVRGPSDAPEIEGEFQLRNLLIGDRSLSSLGGTLVYANQEVETQVIAIQEGRELGRLEGRFPVDLSFREVEERFIDREMDMTIAVDSLPASTAVATLTLLEEVEGVLEGELRFVGSRGDLRPTGQIQLTGGAFSIPDVGLNLSGIAAEFQVSEDFAVEVVAEGRAGGLARVSGSLLMDDPLDPVFDLVIAASGFQAIQRGDLAAQVGGDLTLTGQYSAPLIGGRLTVEEGELFLDEFVRSATVIDLNDPRFADVVDTTLVADQPVVAPAENPFMQNLRVGVALSLESDFWIRSRESTQGMDVEIAGDLEASFDRPRREIVLRGTLEAVRGTYNQFGRQFAIQTGTLEFPGTPGIDPSVAITAAYRLRREEAAPLLIIASVEGTLQDPQVTLTSESQPPIPESDLISYLLFGRPSFMLASNDSRLVNEALTGVVSYGVSQLGTQVSQSLGVDYLSISQAQRPGEAPFGFRALRSQFADTQIEMGRYIGNDLFASLAIRPLADLGPASSARSGSQLPSLRLEWTFAEFWSLEGFLEERLNRQGSAGFSELGNASQSTWGLSIFRDWGY